MNRPFHVSSLIGAALALLGLALPVGAADLPDFTELAKANGPAVVNISTQQAAKTGKRLHHFKMPDLPDDSPFNEMFRRFFEDPESFGHGGKAERRSLGSGFLISEDGYVVTNHHVVDGAEEIIVRLTDRREFKAKVIGSDSRSDVALLKIDAKGLPTVKSARQAEVQVGEWVLAIGSPFGFDHSVTAGIVSAKGRSLPDDTYVPFIQTDVAINPGNSGGPLFNLKGEVVGVNSQIYSRTGGYMGLAFAIPIDVAMNVVDQLRSKGRVTRGWLGVYIQDVTRELAESFGLGNPSGALVSRVMPDSPAEQAGLQVGDVILSYNGAELPNSSLLPHLVGQSPVGLEAALEILRRGDRQRVKVTIKALPEDAKVAAKPDAPSSQDRLGLTVRDLNKEDREQLEISKPIGVLVTQLSSGPAANAGILVDDVILMIDNKPVSSGAEFGKLVEGLPADRSIAILVQRKKGTLFLALRIPKN